MYVCVNLCVCVWMCIYQFVCVLCVVCECKLVCVYVGVCECKLVCVYVGVCVGARGRQASFASACWQQCIPVSHWGRGWPAGGEHACHRDELKQRAAKSPACHINFTHT